MPGERLSDLPYRRGVGILLLNREDRVFVAQRIDSQVDAWQMPQGGIDPGESPRAAVRREMQEEIGTDRAEVIAESREWLRYDLPADLQRRVWDGRYRGQEQKWFAMRFLGLDSDIDIATEHPEFNDWKWTSLQALPDLIVPFKRPLYRRLVEEFAELASDRKPS
jgi:putative (di)nucleoside polyphosphate hydrolase